MLAACSQHKAEPQMEIPTPTKRLLVFKQRLGLTVEQMDAIKPILEEERQRKTALMETLKDGDEEEQKAARHALEDLDWDIFKKVSEHLTKEQVDELVTLLLEEDQKKSPGTAEPDEKPQRRGRGPRR